MTIRFSCDCSKDPEALPHFWEHCVGSGHATLALRADWQAQLKQCHEELGFRHVRFHGILNDDMGTLVDEQDELLYSFHNIDQIFDFLRSIGMRPFVELSFMPGALALGDQTTFHYKANVTPPADYAKWAVLISRLARHWIDRYGAKEVSLWPIEVWNEPNLESFWSGSQQDYFRLFETTWKALKHVHPELTVGGPATAQNAWIDEFIEYCEKASVPPDFISTHTYPTDARGSPDDDTEHTLSKSTLGILRQRAKKVRKQAGKRPLYYTEWSTSSNPRDELHDDSYAAAYITQAMLNMGELVDAYSYWTFSDIFEENYFPSKPFHGGFGLMNIHGIPKPAYRAYEILHGLGQEKLAVKGRHATVQAWVVRGEDVITVLIANLALPLHEIKAEKINFEFFDLPSIASARTRRIDADHANAKTKWKMLGEPGYPSPDEIQTMIEASKLRDEDINLKRDDETTTFELTVQPQSVTTVELRLAASKTKPVATSTDTTAMPYALTTKGNMLQPSEFRCFTENTKRRQAMTLGRWLGLCIVLQLLSACAGASPHMSFLDPQGPVADAQRLHFYWVLGVMAVLVAGPIFLVLPFFAWRYRYGNKSARYTPKWKYSRLLEIFSWGGPIIIVVVLAFFVWPDAHKLDPYKPLASDQPALRVQVIGYDWKWLFIYPDQGIATIGTLAMPVGRPVSMDLTSATVMQSFFIPALGSQIYAMGGMVTQLNLQADKPGRSLGENTMYNGNGFHQQKFTADAMTPAQFKTWVANIRENGTAFDARALKAISQRSTRAQLIDALPGANSSDGNVYFTGVSKSLFPTLVSAIMNGKQVDLTRADIPTTKTLETTTAKQAAMATGDTP